jgi:hypothetical protein
MLNIEAAKSIVTSLIHKKTAPEKGKWVIVDAKTYETPSGWVFTWATKEWVETEGKSGMGVGNMPILVDKYNGSTHFMKWPQTVKEFAHEYELKHAERRPANHRISDE